jgi:hypothetical protein
MNTLARRGLWALPVAGALVLAGWFYFLGGPSVQNDPEGYARSITSAASTVVGYAYLVGLLCLLFGLLALYAYLAPGPAHTWAAAGMILGVASVALLLGAFAVLVLGAAVVADVFLSGHQDVSAAIVKLSGGSNLSGRIIALLVVIILLGLAGAVATATAVWRSGKAPEMGGHPASGGVRAYHRQWADRDSCRRLAAGFHRRLDCPSRRAGTSA